MYCYYLTIYVVTTFYDNNKLVLLNVLPEVVIAVEYF